MSATKHVYETLLPYLVELEPRLQAIATMIVGSDGATRTVLAERVKMSPSWVHKIAIPALREALADVAEIKSGRGIPGYRLRMLSDEEIVARQAAITEDDEPEDTAESETPAAVAEPASPVKSRAPHWFVFPWTGVVNLRHVIGVDVQNGQLVAQLTKGAFLRGPKHPEAERVAAAMIEQLTRLESVRVTVYGQDT